MSPVKVFGSAAFTNVARVLVCLEEVGAEYEVVDVDFHTVEHKGPEHLARNVTRHSSRSVHSFRLPNTYIPSYLDRRNLIYLLSLHFQPFGQVPAFQDGDLMLFRKFGSSL